VGVVRPAGEGVSNIPGPSREAAEIDRREFWRFGAVRSVLAYFDKRGLWTQPYWPAGSHGKVWSFLRGRGWRIT
jgi:hypothetical protein